MLCYFAYLIVWVGVSLKRYAVNSTFLIRKYRIIVTLLSVAEEDEYFERSTLNNLDPQLVISK